MVKRSCKPQNHGCDCLCMVDKLSNGHRLEFLLRKSIQKRHSNQNQRVPNMRIQALLESTEKLVIDGLYSVVERPNSTCFLGHRGISVQGDHVESGVGVSLTLTDEELEQELGLDAFFMDLKKFWRLLRGSELTHWRAFIFRVALPSGRTCSWWLDGEVRQVLSDAFVIYFVQWSLLVSEQFWCITIC